MKKIEIKIQNQVAWLVAMCQFFFLKGNNDKLFDLSCQNKRKQIFFIVGKKWGDEGYRVILFYFIFYDFTIAINISTINFSKIYVL